MNNPNLNLAMPQGLSRVRIAVGVVVAFLSFRILKTSLAGCLQRQQHWSMPVCGAGQR